MVLFNLPPTGEASTDEANNLCNKNQCSEWDWDIYLRENP